MCLNSGETRLTKPRIGVVGGSGYIGSTIADHLSSACEVKIIDKLPVPSSLKTKVDYEQCNIIEYGQVCKALSGLDLVIHTAIIQIPLINEKKRLGYEVNMLGTQNVCKCVDETPSIKGMLLSGTWHVFGERELVGKLDESFGFRPDKVEGRARLYALCKIAQEVIMRYYDEMSEKVYGVIRMGTVIGAGMPEKTAANIFISKGLAGQSITPFKHSMYRPMLYVDILDVCEAFHKYANKILQGGFDKQENSLAHIVNLYWPEPITILEMGQAVADCISRLTDGKIRPRVEIVDAGQPVQFDRSEKEKMKVNVNKAHRFLGMNKMRDPRKGLEELIKTAISGIHTQTSG